MKKLTLVLMISLLVLSLFVFAGISYAKDPKDLKVAAIFNTAIEEPWDGCIHQALIKGQKEFGYKYEYTEKVPSSDYEHVMREYATRGFDVLFLDVFTVEEAARMVAMDYPEVAFVAGSGLGPMEPNFAVFDDWIHEPAYLAGMIAGKITKTNVLGVVGGYPIPEVNRLINAFIAGAKEVNPKAKVKVTFIGSWFDPPKAKEAALAQIDAGADVLYAERYGVIEACKEKGVYAIGNLTDQSELGPKTVIASPVWDMWPLVKEVITEVSKGTFKAMDYREWTMMAKGGAKLVLNPQFPLPDDIKKMIEERTKKILMGTFRVPVDENTPKSD